VIPRVGKNVSSLFRSLTRSVQGNDGRTASSEESCRFSSDVTITDDSDFEGRKFPDKVSTVLGMRWPTLFVVEEDGEGVEFVIEPRRRGCESKRFRYRERNVKVARSRLYMRTVAKQCSPIVDLSVSR